MTRGKAPVTPNPWADLRRLTAARIALGRAGVSLPTAAHLAFQLAHAQARDAVHRTLDVPQLMLSLRTSPDTQDTPCIALHSAAADRGWYLQRPDLGRRLDTASRETLTAHRKATQSEDEYPYDLAFVVADGLSALAIEQNAAPFLHLLLRRIAGEHWRIAPIGVVAQGRVAIGDEVAELLGAKAVVVLVGERPGLSSPDSMGLYLTWRPRVGLTDASRNCISNVRAAGLSHADAACKLHYLMLEMVRRQLSGVELKDDAAADPVPLTMASSNFLL